MTKNEFIEDELLYDRLSEEQLLDMTNEWAEESGHDYIYHNDEDEFNDYCDNFTPIEIVKWMNDIPYDWCASYFTNSKDDWYEPIDSLEEWVLENLEADFILNWCYESSIIDDEDLEQIERI